MLIKHPNEVVKEAVDCIDLSSGVAGDIEDASLRVKDVEVSFRSWRC